MRKYLIPVGAIVVMLLAIPVVATAIPVGEIHACVNASGVLQITDAAEECNGQSEHISWNQQGVPGQDGTDGVDGTNGVDGADGVSGFVAVSQSAAGFNPTSGPVTASVHVLCPTGTKALGGGGSGTANSVLSDSHPTSGSAGWRATFRVDSTGTYAITANAQCVIVD